MRAGLLIVLLVATLSCHAQGSIPMGSVGGGASSGWSKIQTGTNTSNSSGVSSISMSSAFGTVSAGHVLKLSLVYNTGFAGDITAVSFSDGTANSWVADPDNPTTQLSNFARTRDYYVLSSASASSYNVTVSWSTNPAYATLIVEDFKPPMGTTTNTLAAHTTGTGTGSNPGVSSFTAGSGNLVTVSESDVNNSSVYETSGTNLTFDTGVTAASTTMSQDGYNGNAPAGSNTFAFGTSSGTGNAWTTLAMAFNAT